MSKKKNDRAEPEKENQEKAAEAENKPEETAADAPETADSPEDLRKELEEANAKAAEYLSLAQRVQADFENFRRRNESV